MGFKADVIIWSFQDKKLYCRLSLHKVKVQAVAFSPNDKYLATLGGRDDNRFVIPCHTLFCFKNIFFSVVIWDIAGKEAICGSQAAMQSAGPVYALAFCKCSDDLLVTGGE